MMIRKLFVLLLVVAFAWPAAAFAAAQTDDKKDELPPELKKNALKLLAALTVEIKQFKLPENRAGAGTVVADLLWRHDDEAAARAVYRDVFADLQSLFAAVNTVSFEELSEGDRTEHFYKRLRLVQLRRDYILKTARRDPKLALEALEALKAVKGSGYDPLAASETELEMQLAAEIGRQDPDKAFALAKDEIAAKGITTDLIESIKALHKKDSALAARIAREALALIKTVKIRTSATTGETKNDETQSANAAELPKIAETDFWHITNFINAATEMNRQAARDKKIESLLTDAEMRELTGLLADRFLADPNPTPYLVSTVMTEITLYSPAQAQLIRRKVGAKTAAEFDRISESTEYARAVKEKNADELTQFADRSAPELRDHRYAHAVRRALEENDLEKARSIAARIKDREIQGVVLETIKAEAPLVEAKRGDLPEIRKMLGGLKTNHERVAALLESAATIAGRGDTAAAKSLLAEARPLMPARFKTKTDLVTFAKLADVYSNFAPDEAFSIVENGIAETNKLVEAAAALDDYYQQGSLENGEMYIEAIGRQAFLHVRNASGLLKNLARADYERATALADKFERPEIRLFVRLNLVQALLDSDAAEKEKKMRELAEALTGEH